MGAERTPLEEDRAMNPVDLLTRRQALARAAYLLGGALSAPTMAGVLAGCEVPGAVTTGTWRPRTLSPEQNEMVLMIAEHILPETDTPGARAARVNRFIDAMLTDYYSEGDRQRFLAGLVRADARARRVFGQGFGNLPSERQGELVRALNQAAFQESRPQPPVPPEQVARPEDPVLQEHDVQTGNQHALPTVDSDWHPEDSGPGSFFRTLKELALVGYYASEVGASQELRVNPMGTWRADIPYAEIGRSWA
jgi:gluconate 2-dehydrogenase gamma chain